MTNPISLIKSDHRKVIELFDTYKSLEAHEAKEEIANQIIKELAVHAKMEEKFFYPRLKEILGATNPKIVEDALAEHHAAKVLLTELRIMSIKDPKYDSRMQVLEDSVIHHIDEEETTLLPFAHDVMSKTDAEDLGKEMKEYKEDAHKGLLEKLFS
jgi:hemerythrin-like domain-containing protein